MKILVFEYICGGGFAGQALPPSLAAEGGMMLQALIDDLKPLPALQLLIPLDKRCLELSLPPGADTVLIGEDQDVISLLPDLIGRCDAVWPIAPETDGLLTRIADMAVAQHKTLLLSSSEAVALCGDKLATYRLLSAKRIPVVETVPITGSNGACFTRSVIKPVDGIGCQGSVIIDNQDAFQQAINDILFPERYAMQPFCSGQAISLSCLFKQGKAWLLCCNRQQIEIDGNRFVLRGCLVNTPNPRRVFYQNLIEKIAEAIPGLWGYIGIDIIETPDQGPLVLEINPRLTTSYAGIRQATGINIAEKTLQLLQADPVLQQIGNRTINIAIT